MGTITFEVHSIALASPKTICNHILSIRRTFLHVVSFKHKIAIYTREYIKEKRKAHCFIFNTYFLAMQALHFVVAQLLWITHKCSWLMEFSGEMIINIFLLEFCGHFPSKKSDIDIECAWETHRLLSQNEPHGSQCLVVLRDAYLSYKWYIHFVVAQLLWITHKCSWLTEFSGEMIINVFLLKFCGHFSSRKSDIDIEYAWETHRLLSQNEPHGSQCSVVLRDAYLSYKWYIDMKQCVIAQPKVHNYQYTHTHRFCIFFNFLKYFSFLESNK